MPGSDLLKTLEFPKQKRIEVPFVMLNEVTSRKAVGHLRLRKPQGWKLQLHPLTPEREARRWGLGLSSAANGQ